MRSALPSRADVVIIGGRPAGASLALRLAHVDEREFGDATSTCRRLLLDVDDSYRVSVETVEIHGRDYVYGIDRARFDAALWNRLQHFANVTACADTAFLDVVRDDGGTVEGVHVRASDGTVHAVKASCVVGADGRFSPFASCVGANCVGAKIIEDFPLTSTAHFATWEGVSPPDDDLRPTIHIHTDARGLDVLFFPTTLGRTNVCTHYRSDEAQIGGSARDYYLRTLSRFPEVARRIQHAKMLGPVVGLKRIANRFREPQGPGWCLAGDAYYHKDHIHGQGIYDALCGTKILAEELIAWHSESKSRQEALQAYATRSWEALHPTFVATTRRIRRELYSRPPRWVVKTFMRWMLTDPRYGRGLLEYICRVRPAETWPPPSLVMGAMTRGLCRDVSRLWTS